MTSKCPACGLSIEIAFTHQGVSSDGVLQRGVIEAEHPRDEKGVMACAGWKATEQNLVALVAEAT